MSVVRIDALCECDACQKRFGVEIDLSTNCVDFADFDAMVHKEVLAGNGTYYLWTVRAKQTVDRVSLTYQPTIQGNLLLCDICSKICDGLPVEGDLTRNQILQALGLPAENHK